MHDKQGGAGDGGGLVVVMGGGWGGKWRPVGGCAASINTQMGRSDETDPSISQSCRLTNTFETSSERRRNANPPLPAPLPPLCKPLFLK